MQDIPDMLTVRQIVELTDGVLSGDTIRREIKRGSLRGGRIGMRKLVVSRVDLIAYLKERGLDTSALERKVII